MPISEYIKGDGTIGDHIGYIAAIAEPRRRGDSGSPRTAGASRMTWLVEELGWLQPGFKHLGVLREVGLVSVVRKGEAADVQREWEELKPVYSGRGV